MELLVITTTVFWPVTVGFFVLLFWLSAVVFGTGRILLDYAHGRSTRVGTAVRCPNGHVLQTDGDVYKCEGCSYVYTGSIWLCENVECKAVTPFIQCRHCELSVRNPYRWGR